MVMASIRFVRLKIMDDVTTGIAIATSVFAMAPLFTGRGELTISVRVIPSPFALCMIIMYIIPITVPMVTPTAAAAAA